MSWIRGILAVAFFLLFDPVYTQAQNDTAKVKLIFADILQYNKSINPDYMILTGSAVFEYENALLYCDQAKIYLHQDLVITKGNVHIIVNDTTNMYGDSLRIDGDSELCELIGNVKLIDNDITLTTNHLFYNFGNKTAYYLTGGEITDPSGYLTSRRGYYYQDTKNIFFSDSVYVKNNENTEMFSDTLMYNTKTEITRFYGKTKILQKENILYCESGTYDTKNDIGRFSKNVQIISNSGVLDADSVFYNKLAGYSEAFFHVQFKDSTENIILSSHYGKFFDSDSTFFSTDSALLRIVEAHDTLYLHADSLILINDTLQHFQKVLFAFNKARLWRNDFQAISDSIVLLQQDSILYMFNNPVMWIEQTQLVADTLVLTYQNNQLDRLYLNENAMIILQEKTNDFQQIKSRNMEGIFENNDLNRLWANNESETIYYVFDEKMLLIGINKTTSEKVKITFSENKVENITFYNLPKGTLFPEEQLPKTETKLNSFRWEESARPKYPADVFRDPETEPEAKPRIALQIDSLSLNDSARMNNNVLSSDSINIPATQESSSGKTRNPGDVHTKKLENEHQASGKVTLKKTEDVSQPQNYTMLENKTNRKQCLIVRWLKKFRDKRIKKTSINKIKQK